MLIQNESKLKLVYKNICLGEVIYTDSDFPWLCGKLKANDNFEIFKPFFYELVESLNEGNEFDETKWNKDWSEFENWTLLDEEEIIDICLPMIYEEVDGYFDIGWRLRF
ncbi:hypothetical protein SAMN02745163_03693 [Clostridium cavendishii DSM 21758]|uniref:Uncharacterized protein n=1 Tax=Clostridium cavendishii DSM 21758 TaxID=1121302 RepID=A0A1M6RXG9_9CLOT|nr:hypothetical protein [Clostridium cavendishii]SHK36987.1 hypothetical protein SAMN02745163_03693 [Clostridium cavendishii DSM 21758]